MEHRVQRGCICRTDGAIALSGWIMKWSTTTHKWIVRFVFMTVLRARMCHHWSNQHVTAESNNYFPHGVLQTPLLSICCGGTHFLQTDVNVYSLVSPCLALGVTYGFMIIPVWSNGHIQQSNVCWSRCGCCCCCRGCCFACAQVTSLATRNQHGVQSSEHQQTPVHDGNRLGTDFDLDVSVKHFFVWREKRLLGDGNNRNAVCKFAYHLHGLNSWKGLRFLSVSAPLPHTPLAHILPSQYLLFFSFLFFSTSLSPSLL